MANDCWNKAIVRGDEAKLKTIFDKFNSSEHGVFNMSNYKTLLISDVSDMDEEDFGSKRFTPSCEFSDGELIITGDSAWSPMIGLFETICADYEVEIELFFEEPGYDFAGKMIWNKNGVLKEADEWTYWENKLISDPDNFWEEMSWRSEIYSDFDEMVEDFTLDKWKDSSILDLDKLESIWEKHNDESDW